MRAVGTAGERNETVWKSVIASEARQSACQFVILSAAKDLILRKQADCRAPSRNLNAKVKIAAGARSDGLAAASLRWAKLSGTAIRLLVRHPEISEGSSPQETGRLPRPLSSPQCKVNPAAGARSDGQITVCNLVAKLAIPARAMREGKRLSPLPLPQWEGKRLPRPLLSSQGKGHSSGGGSQ